MRTGRLGQSDWARAAKGAAERCGDERAAADPVWHAFLRGLCRHPAPARGPWESLWSGAAAA